MANPEVSNPNDYKVVTFHNKSDLDFTPELGCMYDSRPIFGASGAAIKAGESVVLPYHVGSLLAQNLAKAVLNAQSSKDTPGIPTGVPLWDDNGLNTLKQSYLTEMYREDRPAEMSETDKLMAKVEEYKSMVEKIVPDAEKEESPKGEQSAPTIYSDKSEVIAALREKEIKFDARKSKADLEKLLA